MQPVLSNHEAVGAIVKVELVRHWTALYTISCHLQTRIEFALVMFVTLTSPFYVVARHA